MSLLFLGRILAGAGRVGALVAADALQTPLCAIARRTYSTAPSPFARLCNESLARIKRTTVGDLRNSKPGAVIVDVRENDEVQKNGRIPGAVHLPRGIVERDVHKVVSSPDVPVYVYCAGGLRSALVVDNLDKMGYKNAVSVDGGFAEWAKNGFPVEK
eukprot:Opistho-1_new@20501